MGSSCRNSEPTLLASAWSSHDSSPSASVSPTTDHASSWLASDSGDAIGGRWRSSVRRRKGVSEPSEIAVKAPVRGSASESIPSRSEIISDSVSILEWVSRSVTGGVSRPPKARKSGRVTLGRRRYVNRCPLVSLPCYC